VLFDKISRSIRILCFYGDIIVNTDNNITYNGESNEFLTIWESLVEEDEEAQLDMKARQTM